MDKLKSVNCEYVSSLKLEYNDFDILHIIMVTNNNLLEIPIPIIVCTYVLKCILFYTYKRILLSVQHH